MDCVLRCRPRLLHKKKDDGTFDKEAGTVVSYRWLDGTLICQNGGGTFPDVWVRAEEATMGPSRLQKHSKAIRFCLFKMKENCSCGGFHQLASIQISSDVAQTGDTADKDTAAPSGEPPGGHPAEPLPPPEHPGSS